MSEAVIILAAGRGARAGGGLPKQYRDLQGAPLIRRTAECFLNPKSAHAPVFAPIIIVIDQNDRELYEQALGDTDGRLIFVSGGATRQESALNGLRFLQASGNPPAYVYIHDAARPFIRPALLERIQAELTPQNGVLPALPVSDSLKRADGRGFITETVPRAGLYSAQTPQAFPFAAILAAHEAAQAQGRADFTDDSAVAEAYGLAVRHVDGDSDNIKITWERDIAVAECLLQSDERQNAPQRREAQAKTRLPFPDIRTGNGYDVHQLGAGDGVILCGVKIPCPYALLGHSDADVALHALTDALLATCGEGDIGAHFPPSDPQWKGAASEIFVRHAAQILAAKGGQIINADISLICEEPRIAPYRAAMAEKLQSMLGLTAERVSVKATTNETLGFIGRKEGIAALATANVFYQ